MNPPSSMEAQERKAYQRVTFWIQLVSALVILTGNWFAMKYSVDLLRNDLEHYQENNVQQITVNTVEIKSMQLQMQQHEIRLTRLEDKVNVSSDIK